MRVLKDRYETQIECEKQQTEDAEGKLAHMSALHRGDEQGLHSLLDRLRSDLTLSQEGCHLMEQSRDQLEAVNVAQREHIVALEGDIQQLTHGHGPGCRWKGTAVRVAELKVAPTRGWRD